MGKNLISIDEQSNSYVSEQTHKHLDTGYLKYHYRANTQFIVREKVLYGFKHQFLDGVDLFTIHGQFIAKLYRIRENKYFSTASKEIVSKLINEYLYSTKNREKLQENLDQLYEPNSANIIRQTIVNNFITNHEK